MSQKNDRNESLANILICWLAGMGTTLAIIMIMP